MAISIVLCLIPLTDDQNPCGWTESSVGDILRYASVIGSVHLPHLDDDQVAVRGLNVIRIPLRLNFHPVLQPVNLERRRRRRKKGKLIKFNFQKGVKGSSHQAFLLKKYVYGNEQDKIWLPLKEEL